MAYGYNVIFQDAQSAGLVLDGFVGQPGLVYHPYCLLGAMPGVNCPHSYT